MSYSTCTCLNIAAPSGNTQRKHLAETPSGNIATTSGDLPKYVPGHGSMLLLQCFNSFRAAGLPATAIGYARHKHRKREKEEEKERKRKRERERKRVRVRERESVCEREREREREKESVCVRERGRILAARHAAYSVKQKTLSVCNFCIFTNCTGL